MGSDTESESGERRKLNFTDNLDVVFNYLSSNRYPVNFSRDDKKQLRRKSKNFIIKDSALLYKLNGNYVRVITDKQERLRVVKACHEGLGETKQSKALGGHHGRDKTSKKITERYFWPGIVGDVKHVIDHCDNCQRVNRRFEKVQSKLHSIPVTAHPWRQIGIDLLGPLPETPEGYKYIVTAIDYYTKWPEAAPLTNKSATAVAQFLYSLICRHGCPEIEISDQGREFVNQVQQELHQLTGVEHRVASAYHPQTNGLVERQNQTTQTGLLKHLEGSQDEWEKVLDGVLFAYRTSVHSSTGYSPFFLLYGRQPRLPIDVEMNPQEPQNNYETDTVTDGASPSVDDMVQRMKTLREAAAGKAITNIKKAQARQKKYYDQRHESSTVCVGEKVLKKNMRNLNRVGGTMDERWTGPYVVTQSCKKGVYRLKSLKTKLLLKKKVNASQLKRYREPLRTETKDNVINKEEKTYKLRTQVRETSKEEETREEKSDKRKDQDMTSEQNSKKVKTNPVEEAKSENEESTAADLIMTPIPEPKTILFDPVDGEWQEKICNKFSLTASELHTKSASKEVGISAMPKLTIRIRGDGNCFFRSISYIVTGTQKYHKRIRDLVVQYLENNARVFKKIHDREDYIDETCMDNLGEWATEVEIIATASLFATDIYVFSPYGNGHKWVKYGQLRGAAKLLSRSKCKMYISNLSEHFVPVMKM